MRVWVGFSTTNRLLSRVIRWVTRSRVSHVWLSWESRELGQRMVMEAHWDFRAIPYASFARANTVVKEIEIRRNGEALVKSCVDFLGQPYDYTGIVGGLWVQLGKWLRRRWRNPLGKSDAQTCSEAVTRGLQEIGRRGARRLDAESTSPQDLLEFLEG